MNLEAILEATREAIPSLTALYLFGSQSSGDAGPESDLDLAILADSPPDEVGLWQLSGQLADLAGCPVDLLDLRAASTVMQYRIITTGKRVWACNSDVSLYESFILSDKTALDEARAGLLDDIRRTGTIYG